MDRNSSNSLSELWRFRHAALLLTRRELHQRVGGTLLGFGWLIAQPAFLLLVYGFVFGYLLKVRFNPGDDTGAFALYLMAGLLPFSLFQEAVQRGADSLREHRALVEKGAFPTLIIPLVPGLSSLVSELLGLVVLIAGAVILTGRVSHWLWLLPLLIVSRFLIGAGLALFMSTLTLFVRDLQQLLAMAMTLWFFATPIVYPQHMIPPRWSWFFELNPFYHLVNAYRAVIIDGAPPAPGFYITLLGALGVTLAGRWFFTRTLERAKEFL